MLFAELESGEATASLFVAVGHVRKVFGVAPSAVASPLPQWLESVLRSVADKTARRCLEDEPVVVLREIFAIGHRANSNQLQTTYTGEHTHKQYNTTNAKDRNGDPSQPHKTSSKYKYKKGRNVPDEPTRVTKQNKVLNKVLRT